VLHQEPACSICINRGNQAGVTFSCITTEPVLCTVCTVSKVGWLQAPWLLTPIALLAMQPFYLQTQVLWKVHQHMPGLCRQQHMAAAAAAATDTISDSGAWQQSVSYSCGVLACRLSVEDTLRQFCRSTAVDIEPVCCAESRAVTPQQREHHRSIASVRKSLS
jgi:hypothetical protein